MTLSLAAQLPQAAADALRAANPNIRVQSIGWNLAAAMGGDVDALALFPAQTEADRNQPAPAGWPGAIRWVQLLSAGHDGYPEWVFDAPLVTSARGFNAIPVAEFAMALILAHAKRLRQIGVREPHEWKYQPLRSVAGTTLGLVGMGAVGSNLARRAIAMDMRVLAVRGSDKPMPEGVERAADLSELMRESDHIVLAAPSTTTTRGAINAAALASARPGFHLVNVARGDLIDETALIAALDHDTSAAASLDVLTREPPVADLPLLRHPRIFVTPHVASSMPDLLDRLVAVIARNAALLDAGETPANIISRGDRADLPKAPRMAVCDKEHL